MPPPAPVPTTAPVAEHEAEGLATPASSDPLPASKEPVPAVPEPEQAAEATEPHGLL
jgi:hypothetical protein